MAIISSDYFIHNPNLFTIRPISPPQIKFLFTCSFTISVYPSFRQNSLARPNLQLQANVSVSLEQFRCYPETHALIREKIKHMPIFDNLVIDNLIQNAYRQAEEALASIPATDAHVYVRCRGWFGKLSLGSCCICLEEFSVLDASMPCQHVFHRECIAKWLRVNRSCPMCRFQMP